jgi:hypothetical protein
VPVTVKVHIVSPVGAVVLVLVPGATVILGPTGPGALKITIPLPPSARVHI